MSPHIHQTPCWGTYVCNVLWSEFASQEMGPITLMLHVRKLRLIEFRSYPKSSGLITKWKSYDQSICNSEDSNTVTRLYAKNTSLPGCCEGSQSWLEWGLMHTGHQKDIQESWLADSLAFLALVSGLDGVGIPLLFVWEGHWVLRGLPSWVINPITAYGAFCKALQDIKG